MSFAIEIGDTQKFTALQTAVYENKLCEANMLWYARVKVSKSYPIQ